VGLALLVCLVSSGCGAKKVQVKGQLSFKGQPLVGKEREKITVRFVPYREGGSAGGPPVPADVQQESGTYTITVPAGTYRICVAQFTEGLQDRFNNAFGEGVSKIIREVKEETEINLDLAKEPK
jgi:hypothetical protein